MKKILFVFAASILILAACSTGTSSNDDPATDPVAEGGPVVDEN